MGLDPSEKYWLELLRGGAIHLSKLGTFVISVTTYSKILMIRSYFLIFTISFTTVALEVYCGIFFWFQPHFGNAFRIVFRTQSNIYIEARLGSKYTSDFFKSMLYSFEEKSGLKKKRMISIESTFLRESNTKVNIADFRTNYV